MEPEFKYKEPATLLVKEVIPISVPLHFIDEKAIYTPSLDIWNPSLSEPIEYELILRNEEIGVEKYFYTTYLFSRGERIRLREKRGGFLRIFDYFRREVWTKMSDERKETDSPFVVV